MKDDYQPFGMSICNKGHKIEINDYKSNFIFFISILVSGYLSFVIQGRIAKIILGLLILCIFIKAIVIDAGQWHSIAHRLAYLLENDFPLDIESFENASLEHGACGIFNRLLFSPSKRKIKKAIEAGLNSRQN